MSCVSCCWGLGCCCRRSRGHWAQRGSTSCCRRVWPASCLIMVCVGVRSARELQRPTCPIASTHARLNGLCPCPVLLPPPPLPPTPCPHPCAAQVSERMLRSLRPADLAALLRAVVALHMQPHAAWLQQAIQCSRKALQEFSPRDLVAVLNALNTLTGSQTPALASGTTPSSAEAGVGPLSWGRTQAADPGQAVLGSPQPSQVAAAVAAAAAAAGLSTQDPQGQQLSLWDRPSSVGRPWPAPEAPNPSAVSPASTGRDAATAQASMQASSGPAATAARAALEKGWIRAFLAAAEHALPRFTAQDLARLLSALAAAKARPGKAWMAAYQGWWLGCCWLAAGHALHEALCCLFSRSWHA